MSSVIWLLAIKRGIMKIKICTKVSASILTILAIMPNIISTAFSDEAQQKSPIYLTLQGVVDLEYGKGPTEPYLVEGRLTGGTSYSLNWIYTILLKGLKSGI